MSSGQPTRHEMRQAKRVVFVTTLAFADGVLRVVEAIARRRRGRRQRRV